MNLNEPIAELTTNDNEGRMSIISESTSELYADVFEPVTKTVSLSTAERAAYIGKLTKSIHRMFCCVSYRYHFRHFLENVRRNLKARKRRYAVCFIPIRSNEASLNQYNSQTTTSITNQRHEIPIRLLTHQYKNLKTTSACEK